MRLLTVPLLIVLAAASLAQNSLEGRWNVTGKKMPPKAKAVANFSGGRLAIRASTLERGRQMTIDLSGTYTIKSGRLVTKFTDAKLDPTPFTAAERKKMFSPQGKAQFRKMFLQNPGPEGKVRWLGKNRFELVSKNGDVSTFARIR